MMANQATMTGNWNELKGRVRSKWGQLTDDMLEQTHGNIESLIGTIQRTTGEARDKIQEFLNSGGSQGSAMASDLYNRASEAVRAGTEQAMEGARQVGDTLRTSAEQTGKMVQARPVESLMFTFGAGVVAGLALGLVLRSR